MRGVRARKKPNSPERGLHPTILGWAKRENITLKEAIARFAAGKAPPRTGIARFGPAGESEHLNAWTKRQGISKLLALKLYNQGLLNNLGVIRGQREWYETAEGAGEVLRDQHDLSESLIHIIKNYEHHADRLQRWKVRINGLLEQMERNYKSAQNLAARQRTLAAKFRRYNEARRRGDSYISLHDLDALKKRLFGPDLVLLEKHKRRRNWRNYYRRRKQRALAALRAVQQNGEAPAQEPRDVDVLLGNPAGGEPSPSAGQADAPVSPLPPSPESG